MATQTTIYQCIKWTIVVLSVTNMAALTIAVINTITRETVPLDWDRIISIGLTFIILLIPVIGAWKQNYMFLILGGIALVLSIIYSAMGLKSATELHLLMALLTVVTFAYAILIRKRDASLINSNDSF
uniref:Uncharacterized protein n=1 Tax=Tetranychus urticae TaxID=32264 RepID=T1K0H4_TETUR